MTERFAVFEQVMDDTHRVMMIWGPFTKWENASAFCSTMQKAEPTRWFGIRTLEKTIQAKM